MTTEPVVLAAIDLVHPEHAVPILKQAQVMAETRNARLAVISVIPDVHMSLLGPWFREGAGEKVLKAAGDTLHALVRDTLGQAAGEVQHILRQGTAYQEILHVAEQRQPSLIVMGAHRPELSDYLIGPNAARVVRHANCWHCQLIIA